MSIPDVAAASAPCPLCGAARVAQRFEKDGAPFFACRGCGFAFARPAVNANLENRIEDYESSYLDYLDETHEDPANLRALRVWMARFGPLTAGPLLDVGAGGGKLVRDLRRHGVDAVGLEPSAALYERFLRGDAHFVCDTLAAYAARTPPGSYAIVTAFDVIEHVPDPDALVRDAARLLRPGGRLYVSTPDVASLPARLLGRRWHYYHRYHLSYLSRDTLRRLAARHGLEPLHFSQRGRYHSIGYALEYFLQVVLGRREARAPRGLYGRVLPMNLFDVVYGCFRKREAAA